MKNLLWILPAVLLCISDMQAQAKTVDRILAQVNDDIITMSDLNREMAQIRRELAQRYSGDKLEEAVQKAEKEALDNLIQEKLLFQKANELGFNANVDTRVSASIQQVMKQNNLKNTDELEAALNQQGMSLKDYRDQIKRQIMNNDLVSEFVGSRITLLTQEIDKYYKDHVADFSTPEEVTLSEIIINNDGDPKSAESKIGDLRQRLQQGEAFATLASQYSKGPTASKGGSIGTYVVSKLNPEIVAAVAGLKDGEVSKPQKARDSYVLYRLDSRKPTSILPLEQVRDEIKNRLYSRKFAPEFERFINQLKEEAYIQIFSEIK